MSPATKTSVEAVSTGQCVDRIFAVRARETPGAVAVMEGEATVTFRDLDRRANRLAHYLAGLGVGPEKLVPVLLDRSIEAVVAILAILKAGGGYVPINTADPPRRVKQILADSSAVAVVTTSEFEDRLIGVTVPLVYIDKASSDIAAVDGTTPPEGGSVPDNVAYVVYTSGSTGEPKGVVSTHRGILDGLSAVPFGTDSARDVCALSSPLSVGFTIARVFLPLLSGVPLRIIPDKDVKDVRRFADALAAGGVTAVGMVTPLLRQLLSLPRSSLDQLSGLKTVTVGGTALSQDLVDAFADRMPHAMLIDGYAASEAGGAILVSTREAASPGGTRSLGQPFANTTVRLLDDDLQPVGVGAIGEIYVAAPHLARGYQGSPSLTASRYVADPFGSDGRRVLRTGDLGRLLPDGEIEYMGRADDQVKIRGYRVVFGEVERALLAHRHVQEAAVTAHPTPQDSRLVAYVVTTGVERDPMSLRDAVATQLPDYMVPSSFIFLDELPLTPAGKVDRSALPPPSPERSELDRPYTSPRTALEATIAQIWADTLGLDRVGIHDDFLELGGDSLIATQVVARIWETFSTEVPFEALFERPTVAALVEQFFPDAARSSVA